MRLGISEEKKEFSAIIERSEEESVSVDSKSNKKNKNFELLADAEDDGIDKTPADYDGEPVRR
mgnify:CR=1 FL=1